MWNSNTGNWKVEFTEAAEEDFRKLDGQQKRIVAKAIIKAAQNPLPHSEGGYGIPPGNKHGFDLTGCCELKLRGEELRIVYELKRDVLIMRNIAVSRRSDLEVYRIAAERSGRSKP